jgi:hypothetical protein
LESSLKVTACAAQLIFAPDVVWALVPAVASTLEDAIFTFRPVKKPRFTQNISTKANMTKPPFLICEPTDKIYRSNPCPIQAQKETMERYMYAKITKAS